MSRRTVAVVLVAILLVGVFLRVLFALQNSNLPIVSDQRRYYRQGVSLATEGKILEDFAVFPPGYMVFVAGLVILVGQDPGTLRVAQAASSVIMLSLCYLLARTLIGTAGGLAATALLALHPHSIVGSHLLLSEFLLTIFLLAAFWSTARILDRPHEIRWSSLAGILWGLAALTRSVAAPFFLGVFLALLLIKLRGGGRIRGCPKRVFIALCASFLVVLAPWTARNYARYGGFIPIDNTLAFKLLRTTTEEVSTREFIREYWPSIGTQVERQREGMSALKKIVSDPGHWLSRCPQQFVSFWSAKELYPTLRADRASRGRPGHVLRCALTTAYPVFHWMILIPAVLGLGLSFRKPWLLLPSAFIVYLTLVHTLLGGHARYRLPLTPLLTLLAVYACVEVGRCVRETRRSRQGRFRHA